MSQKNMRVLRRGADKHHLPLNALKTAFNHLNTNERADFLKSARIDIYG